MVKILGVCGSHRAGGNAESLLRIALGEARALGCDAELLTLHNARIAYCIECDKCGEECVLSHDVNDDAAAILGRMRNADAIIFSTPVLFGSVSGKLKSLFDRSIILRRSGFALRGKIGGAIAVGGSRNGGQELALMQCVAFMLIHDMVVAGDGAPTAHFGGAAHARNPGDAEKDEQGVKTAKNLGKRVAEIAMRLAKG